MASRKLSNTTLLLIGAAAALAIVLAIFLFSPKPDYSYKGFPFEKGACPGTEKLCWYANLEINDKPYLISFFYHPSEVDGISVAWDTIRLPAYANVANHTVYITVPNNVPGSIGIAAIQLGRILGTRNGIFNMNVKAAVWGTDPGEITCANASKNTIVINFEQASKNEVYIKAANCIGIAATSDERAVAVADAFSYRLLGIIPTYKPLNATIPQ
jgi:hypothetical protein